MATKEDIIKKVNDRLLLDDRVVPADIRVNVSDSRVILSGSVPTYTSLKAAENNALFVPGLTGVYNQLRVSLPEELPVPTDSEIKERLQSIYRWHESIRSAKVEVQVQNGWVSLQGTIDSYWKKRIAEDLAYTVQGVIGVKNELQVQPKGLTDERIAQRIKETIELRGDIQVKDLDVHVQHGIVTLSGEVETHSDALAASDAAMYTSGVTGVNDQITVRRNKM